jgi:group II intron reverse transcriptase/maturase
MPITEDENFSTSAGGKERNSRLPVAIGASTSTAGQDNSEPREHQLMEEVLTEENMTKAMKRVEANKGAAGIDDMTIGELKGYLKQEWPRIRGELLEGRYKPKPVRRVMIPKAGGGERALGIPTVVDRFIQQAVHQVISPIFERDFSESSYGYRPKRSAQQAVEAARRYVSEGRRWIVDIDLEKFFDRVNHDILMARVARKVKDKRILLLIRRYLQAGIMEDGLTKASTEGTPQGGPLSPLLSNVLLDDLDKELESRKHKFCRYADDCNIYVHTQRAGERVKESVTLFLSKKLKLKVNEAKSAVGRPWKRKFLGYSMTLDKEPRLKASKQSIDKLKDTLRAIFRRGRGCNIGRLITEELNPVIRGWGNYFSLTRVKKIPEELDCWIRRKIRCILWRQMKRVGTRGKRMTKRGLEEVRAWVSSTNGRGPWWNAGASHMNQAYPITYFNKFGLVNLTMKLINS